MNRLIFDCDSHSHIAAVSSALRYREVVLRRGYRGVHTRFAAEWPPLSGGLTFNYRELLSKRATFSLRSFGVVQVSQFQAEMPLASKVQGGVKAAG